MRTVIAPPRAVLRRSTVDVPAQWDEKTYKRLPATSYTSRRGFVLSRWRKAIGLVVKVVRHKVLQHEAHPEFMRLGQLEEAARDVARFRVAMGDWNSTQSLNTRLFFPCGAAKMMWDVFVLCCIFYSAISEPFQLAFSVHATGWALFLDLLIDLAFLLDVVATFNTAIPSSDGTHYIVSRLVISRTYLRGWFWIGDDEDAPQPRPSLRLSSPRHL
jgi:hypothetical protein